MDVYYLNSVSRLGVNQGRVHYKFLDCIQKVLICQYMQEMKLT